MANQDSAFYKYMIANGAKLGLIEKLIAHDIDDVELIEQMEPKDMESLNLSLSEKLKLKAIIQKLSNKQSIVDAEEVSAVNNMEEKLEEMKKSIDLIIGTTKDIENESGAHSKKIKETFDRIRARLKERENALMDKVHQIAEEKKLKLTQIASDLQTQCAAVKTNIETSKKMMKEPIEMNAAVMKKRKEKILKLLKEVKNVKVVKKTDSMITNNKINVHLDEKKVFEFASKFGVVSGSLLPILVSLKDNGENGVIINWKVNGTKPAQTEPYKIKFEWAEIKKLNDDDQKEQWQQQEVEMNEINEVNDQTINVDFDGDIAFFAFRIRIFEPLKKEWSKASNAVSVTMKNKYSLNGSVFMKDDNVRKLMMENILQQTLKDKKFRLLLRGSEHGFTTEAFYDRCYDKGEILVIMQSKHKEQRIFGGYTKVGFKKGINGYQNDGDAFLYVVESDKAQRFKIKSAQDAIYSHDNGNYGVTFGGGHDIYLYENGKGYCSAHSYDFSSATVQLPLHGGKGQQFTIKDYEVWKVF